MPAKRIIVVDDKLLDKIEGSRGDLSREDFIDFCIDNVLETYVGEESGAREPAAVAAPPEPERVARTKAAGDYATREEFLELKQRITSLMRAFLEFFITFGIELGPGKGGAPDVEQLKAQLRKIVDEK